MTHFDAYAAEYIGAISRFATIILDIFLNNYTFNYRGFNNLPR